MRFGVLISSGPLTTNERALSASAAAARAHLLPRNLNFAHSAVGNAQVCQAPYLILCSHITRSGARVASLMPRHFGGSCAQTEHENPRTFLLMLSRFRFIGPGALAALSGSASLFWAPSPSLAAPSCRRPESVRHTAMAAQARRNKRLVLVCVPRQALLDPRPPGSLSPARRSARPGRRPP